MSFSEDLDLEYKFYDKYFRKYLSDKGYGEIYIWWDDKNIIHQELQKKKDIDVVIENRAEKKNISLSLKVVRHIYEQIFFETVSNIGKKTPGWGYYSQADWIVYAMGDYRNGFPSHFKIHKFKKDDVLKLNINNYPIGYGKTYDSAGNLLYRTEGRLIPLSDFDNELIK